MADVSQIEQLVTRMNDSDAAEISDDERLQLRSMRSEIIEDRRQRCYDAKGAQKGLAIMRYIGLYPIVSVGLAMGDPEVAGSRITGRLVVDGVAVATGLVLAAPFEIIRRKAGRDAKRHAQEAIDYAQNFMNGEDPIAAPNWAREELGLSSD